MIVDEKPLVRSSAAKGHCVNHGKTGVVQKRPPAQASRKACARVCARAVENLTGARVAQAWRQGPRKLAHMTEMLPMVACSS